MTSAYPLQWPPGWPRTPATERSRGYQFKEAGGEYGKKFVTLDRARRLLREELALLGAADVVVSSNHRTGASATVGGDHGVALYFTLNGRQMAMACDRFDNRPANMRSLGLAIEAMRQLERHGGGSMMERAFTGFAALPPPRSCWDLLGIDPGASPETVKAAFRAKAMESHPDRGGNNIDMAALTRARDEALRNAA
jgi:hypothetical protein